MEPFSLAVVHFLYLRHSYLVHRELAAFSADGHLFECKEEEGLQWISSFLELVNR